MSLRSNLIAALLTVVAGSAACGPSQPGQSAQPSGPAAGEPKRIVGVIRGDPSTLSDSINWAAAGATTAGTETVEQLLHTGFLLMDGEGQLQPVLAQAVPTVENGLWQVFADGRMETTWKLRPNLVWHDGAPLTSEDFVFSATVYQDKDVAIRQDPAWAYVDHVAAPDPTSFVVTWKSPYIDADRLFTQSRETRNLPMPRYLIEGPYQQDRTGIVQHPAFNMGYVGAGPFHLKEWVLSSHIVLQANDRYALGRPKLDEIVVRFVPDVNVIVAGVLAGALDLTLGRNAVTEEQAIAVKEQWRDGIVAATLQNTTSLYPQLLNPEPAVLLEVSFRRALLHGLNRQQIVDTFQGGLAPVPDTILTRDEPDYAAIESRIVRYPYDPRRAVELLDGMGLRRGADGIYQDPAAGKPLTIEVRTRANPQREKLQQVIADDWRRIGVLVSAEVVPEQRARDRQYAAEQPGFYFRIGSAFQFNEWISSEAPVPENNFVGVSPIRYRNPAYDALVERYLTTIPRPDRQRALGDIVAHVTDQVLILPVLHESSPRLINNRVANVGSSRGASLQAWNAYEWDVK